MDFDTHLLSSNNGGQYDGVINGEDLREFKMGKTSSSCGDFSQPYYHCTSNAFGRNTVINGGRMEGLRGPFTPSQWMELEHQALIYKYITANVPIPSYLLNPIRKAFHSAGFSLLRSNALGWGGFQLGFSNTDPEPGRCRRTDGKKWRCSRNVIANQKYCERHINRGRHRSRKHVEVKQSNANPNPTPISSVALKDGEYPPNKQQNPSFQEFGSVCSDSLLNPLISSRKFEKDGKSQHELRQFMDKTQLSISIPSDFMSSTSSPTNERLEMGLGVGSLDVDRVPIGGPLGEALHSNAKQLNLIGNWDNGPRLASSPTGVLQRGAFVSLSNSE